MKRLFTFNFGENAQAGLVKSFIESEGIPCVLRNDQLVNALGDVPFTQCYPEIWIQSDNDYPKAKEVLDQWLAPQGKTGTDWICEICAETVEGQFSACWKCGSLKSHE